VFYQDFIERRKHGRFKVLDGMIVLSSFADLCLPTNISGGGLAVKSRRDNNHLIPTQWSIDILLKDERFHANIPIKLAWKKNINHSYFPYLFGIQFDDTTESNRSKVKYLIKLHKELELINAI
jgi:hypothetical protein